MENSLVTYGLNKNREGIEHLKWISDLCSLHSLQVKKKIIGNVPAKNFLKERLTLIANMLFVSKNISLEKVAFMNSSCFVICEHNWIVFMAIVKHFRVIMRLASFCCVNLLNIQCLVSLYLSSAVNLISTLKSTSRTYFFRRISF